MRHFLIAALALFAAQPLVAQTSPQPTQEAIAAARALVATMDMRKNTDANVDATIASMRDGSALSRMLDSNPAIKMERAKNPSAWEAALKRLGQRQADLAGPALRDTLSLAEERAVESYAIHFTVADLKALTDFYKSPLGIRYKTNLPLVTRETSAWLQQENAKRMLGVMQALQPDLKRELEPLLPKSAQGKK
jgi:hypothetical protein